jgi:hypothetical protein
MPCLRVLMATGDEELMITVSSSLPPRIPLTVGLTICGSSVSRAFKSG